MNKKVLFIGSGALAVVAIAVALIFIFTGGSDEYRSIKVFELNGNCTVSRNGDTLNAFKNMSLSSGDSFEVPGEGFARLKLDDDKYVYLEAGTKIELTATGTEKDSKTRVFIERGSMMTEVKRKLSATSSYDIVTPNTTMSIRGTKTLTQVVEDAVTGHVQTSNAVLEGQVKIKAVKVKADGTVVSVEKDLGAGEGNAFSSSKEELVSQEEMKSIADTGSSVSGIKVEIVTEEEAEVVFDVATFEESFLENIMNVLIADAEAEAADAGDEGISAEQQESIDTVLGEIMTAFDEIRTASQEEIERVAKLTSNDPSPVSEITTDYTPDFTSDYTPDYTDTTTPDFTSDFNFTTDDTPTTPPTPTTVITGDGDTNIVGLEADEEAARLAAEEEAARIAEEERLAKEEADRLAEEERLAKEEADRLAEEERLAREEAERLAEEERLAREEAERLAEEERLAREEAERLAEEARLAEEQQAAEEAARIAEEARLAQEEADRAARIAEEARLAQEEATRAAEEAARAAAEAERAAREAAEEAARIAAEAEEAAQKAAEEEAARIAAEEARKVTVTFASTSLPLYNGSGSGSGSSSGTGSTSGSGSTAPESVTLIFKDKNGLEIEAPSRFEPGTALPQTSGTDITVSVPDEYAETYEFTGWYSSNSSGSSSSTPVTTVPQSGSVTVYAGIQRKPVALTFASQAVKSLKFSAAAEVAVSRTITLEYSGLPASLVPGAALPEIGDTGISILIADGDSNYSKRLEFAGWYLSADDAATLTNRQTTLQADGTSLRLYPGLKEKIYKVTYTNTFPEAGRLAIPEGLPSSGYDSTTCLTYKNISTDGANIVEVSGYRFGDGYFYPTPDSSRTPVPTYIFRAQSLPWTGNADKEKLTFMGISESSNLNLSSATHLMEYEYSSDNAIEGLDSPGSMNSNLDAYSASREITGDTNLYAYFALSVDLEITVPAESDVSLYDDVYVYTQNQQKSGTVRTLFGNDDGDPDTYAFVKLWDKTLSTEPGDEDQIWGASYYTRNNKTLLILKTMYYGKKLYIPAFEIKDHASSDNNLAAKYILDNEALDQDRSDTGLTASYSCDRISENAYYSKFIAGSGSESIRALCDSTDGMLKYNGYSIELELTKYLTLDLTGVDYTEGYLDGLITKHKNDSNNLVYLAYTLSDTENLDAKGLKFNIPRDKYFRWEEGEVYGTALTSTTNYDADYFVIGKEGCKLIGFDYTFVGSEDFDPTSFEDSRSLIINDPDDTVDCVYSNFEYQLQVKNSLVNNYIFNDYTGLRLRPVFYNDLSLNLTLSRHPNTASRPANVANTNWALSDYELTLTGSEEDSLKRFTSLYLNNLSLIACEYDVQNHRYSPYYISLGNKYIFNQDNNNDTYTLEEPGSVPETLGEFTSSNGKLSIPLSYFVNAEDNPTCEFIRGITYTNTSNDYIDIHYDRLDHAGVSSSYAPTTISDYKPYAKRIGLPAGANNSYMAVYSSEFGLNLNGPVAVFSEAQSDFNNYDSFIEAVSGVKLSSQASQYTDLNRLKYGGMLVPDAQVNNGNTNSVSVHRFNYETANIGHGGIATFELNDFIRIDASLASSVLVYPDNGGSVSVESWTPSKWKLDDDDEDLIKDCYLKLYPSTSDFGYEVHVQNDSNGEHGVIRVNAGGESDPNKLNLDQIKFMSRNRINANYSVIFTNTYVEAGQISNYQNTGDSYSYTVEGNSFRVSGLKAGDVLKMPEIKDLAQTRDSSTVLPYIERMSPIDTQTEFFCYSNSPDLDVSALYFNEARPTQLDGGVWIMYNPVLLNPENPEETPQVELTVTQDFEEETNIYMYFTSKIELRTIDSSRFETRIPARTRLTDNNTEFEARLSSSALIMETATQNNIIYTKNDDDSVQTWKIQLASGGDTALGPFIFNTVYFGKAMEIPNVEWRNGSVEYTGYFPDILCNFKYSPSDVECEPCVNNMHFAASDSDAEFPFKNNSRTGHFVFTAQAVDWINLNLSYTASGVSTTSAAHLGLLTQDDLNTHFPIGINNPYHILSSSDSSGLFRLAVNAVDLYNGAASEFGLTYDATDTCSTNHSPSYKTLLPDDIIYPWGKVGELRSEGITTPREAFSSLSAASRRCYSFVGVQGHMLIGYRATGTFAPADVESSPETFSQNLFLHCNNGNDGDLVVATPYKYAYTVEGEAHYDYVGNMMSVGLINHGEGYNDFTGLYEPITLTPVFAKVYTPTVTLEYTEEREDDFGGFKSKNLSELRSNYNLVVTGLELDWYKHNLMSLKGIQLNLLTKGSDNLPETEYFVYRNINSMFTCDLVLNNWMFFNPNSNAQLTGGEPVFNSTENSLTIPITKLFASTDSDPQTATNDLANMMFIRGIKAAEDGSSYSEYVPTGVTFNVPDTENFKYSCFMSGIGTSNITVGRVFKSTEGFTNSPRLAYNKEIQGGFESATYNFSDRPTLAGPIMDMAGSDRYSLAYYGGTAAVYQGGTGIYFGNDKNITQLGGTIPSAWELDRRATRSYSAILYTLVGSTYSNGNYAGIFEFKEYNAVQITNLQADDDGAAFCLKSEDGEIYHSRDNSYHVSIKYQKYTGSPVYEGGVVTGYNNFENLSHYYNQTAQFISEQDKTIPLYYNDVTVVEVPKGYLFLRPQNSTYDSNGEILVYFGNDENETYTYTKASLIDEETVNVYDHRAEVIFLHVE